MADAMLRPFRQLHSVTSPGVRERFGRMMLGCRNTTQHRGAADACTHRHTATRAAGRLLDGRTWDQMPGVRA